MDREQFKEEFDPTPEKQATDSYIKKLEAENSALKKQIGTDQILFDHIKDMVVSMDPLGQIKYDKPKLSHDDVEAVLVLTDAHAEEVVLPEEMEGLAAFNYSIFLERMDKTARKTIELVNIMRQASNVRTLTVWSLGDWFCGKIQPQEESYGISMPMPVAVPSVGQAFARFLLSLSPHFEKVRVVGICGNHGRDGKKRVFKMTADRNWDMSVYLIAQGYSDRDERIEWIIPKSIMHVDEIMGYRCLLSHSGEVNMNNRVPYYPIESTIWQEHQARQGTNKDFHLAFNGHWHHKAVLADTIHLCPSLIGPSQFSRFKLHKNADPGQSLFFFTEKHGCINDWTIKL